MRFVLFEEDYWRGSWDEILERELEWDVEV